MHWTYKEGTDTDLCQGDILLPTDDIRNSVFARIHPHFCDPKYLAFMVTTQSCDLVRRNGIPSARYISIASVRSLKDVWTKLLRISIGGKDGRFFRKGSKDRARDLLQRILNQNEQALGLFYLHPSDEVGLGDSAVAFLRVTVALKAEHYPTLLQARSGSLTHEFKAKFGWLLGNLYARADTRDWTDDSDGKAKFLQLVTNFIDDENYPNNGPIWIDDDLYKAGQKAGVDFLAPSTNVHTELSKLAPRTLKNEVVDLVMGRVRGVLRLPEEDSNIIKLKQSLMKDRALEGLLKR